MNLTRDCRGQMVVELAVVFPVILLVLVVSVDLICFMLECACFDGLVSQKVLAQAVSPAGDDSYGNDVRCEAVRKALADKIASARVRISVEVHDGADVSFPGMAVYVCRLDMAPWPLAVGGTELFGMKVPLELSHTRSLVIDPYEPLLF